GGENSGPRLRATRGTELRTVSKAPESAARSWPCLLAVGEGRRAIIPQVEPKKIGLWKAVWNCRDRRKALVLKGGRYRSIEASVASVSASSFGAVIAFNLSAAAALSSAASAGEKLCP